MNNKVKVMILYHYIVDGITTTDMPGFVRKNYNASITSGDISDLFRQYDINYKDRGAGQGRRGYRKGQHCGLYKNGYKGNMIPPKIILDFMVEHNRTNENLEEYLYELFSSDEDDAEEEYEEYTNTYVDDYDEDEFEDEEYEEPAYQQQSYQQPTYKQKTPQYQPTYQQKTYQQPTYQQKTYQEQPTYQQPIYEQQDYQQAPLPDFSYQIANARQRLAVSETIKKYVTIAVVGIISVLILIFGIIPMFNNMTGLFRGGNKDNSSQTGAPVGTDNSVVLSNDICNLTIYVEFPGEGYQMWFKDKYVMYIGNNLQTDLDIGYKHTLDARLYYGYHDIWVQSGNSKSKVWRVKLDKPQNYINFECKVGLFGPEFSVTDMTDVEEITGQ